AARRGKPDPPGATTVRSSTAVTTPARAITASGYVMAFLTVALSASVVSLYVAIRSSSDAKRPDCSAESTRLQKRSSKYSGCLAREDARVLPEATSFRISLISLVKLGLLLP